MANHQPLIHPRVWDKHLKALGTNLVIPPDHAAALQHWAQTIDKMVYGLFELTPEEIALVEGGSASFTSDQQENLS